VVNLFIVSSLAVLALQETELSPVVITSNCSDLSTEKIVAKFKESLAVTNTKGQSIRLSISTLPQGQGGKLNTFVMADVVRENKLFGHWFARCSDAKVLFENRVGDFGVSQYGLLRQLAQEISKQIKSADQSDISLQDLISGIPPINQATFGNVYIWRPEL
jgi:hypothetical protein